jgi:hypothetical protein
MASKIEELLSSIKAAIAALEAELLLNPPTFQLSNITDFSEFNLDNLPNLDLLNSSDFQLLNTAEINSDELFSDELFESLFNSDNTENTEIPQNTSQFEYNPLSPDPLAIEIPIPQVIIPNIILFIYLLTN